MTLPRLELTEDPNKNNDFIIFPHTSKRMKTKLNKVSTKKRVYKKKHGTKKENIEKVKRAFSIYFNKLFHR